MFRRYPRCIPRRVHDWRGHRDSIVVQNFEYPPTLSSPAPSNQTTVAVRAYFQEIVRLDVRSQVGWDQIRRVNLQNSSLVFGVKGGNCETLPATFVSLLIYKGLSGSTEHSNIIPHETCSQNAHFHSFHPVGMVLEQQRHWTWPCSSGPCIRIVEAPSGRSIGVGHVYPWLLPGSQQGHGERSKNAWDSSSSVKSLASSSTSLAADGAGAMKI